MKKPLAIRALYAVLISSIILLLLSSYAVISYADENVDINAKESHEDVIKGHKPSRSGTPPYLKSGVTSTYSATVVAGTQFEFTDNWLEYYFDDAENDPLDFLTSFDNGATYGSTGITYFAGHTAFIYTPPTSGNIVVKICADDGTGRSTGVLTIRLKVIPANNSDAVCTNINIDSSVTDFEIIDSLGTTVSIGSGTTTGNTTTYSTTLSKGTYTYQGKPSNGNQLSGMSFTVPAHAGAGTTSNPDVINIKQVDVTVSAATTLNGSQYNLHLVNAAGNDVTLGVSASTLASYTTIPMLVFANGDAELYYYNVEPINSSNYAAYFEGNVKFTGSDTVTKAITLPAAISCTFDVPAGADVKVFKQLRNYQSVEVDDIPSSPVTSGGRDLYTYKLPQNSNDKTYTYRVSDMANNKVTKAGYLSLGSAVSKTINFDSSSPTEKSLNADGTSKYNSATTLGSRAEDSVLLNVKKDSNTHFSHNFRSLSEGETFKLRAYRGAWQIINSDVDNIMIEPDFHFQVVQGSDLITIDQDPDNNGHQSWCNVTANTGASGLAIVKVTYDAIDVDGMSYSNNTSQKFYATAEGREGYAVFNVGGAEIDGLMINADTSGTRDTGVDWDSEIDTFYYLGSSGTFKIDPTAPNDTITEVAYTQSPTGNFTTVTKSGNYYNIPISGNFNLIRIKAGTKTEYVPIRASQVTVLVDDQPLTSTTTVTKNVNHTIKLRGVYMPVPKFSGIYNPMMNQVNYTVGNTTLKSKSLQYNFITQNTITWKPTASGSYTFSNGFHSMRMFCNVTARWGHHRLLTDTGVGANFSAGLVNGVFNVYPQFSITVS